MNLLYILILVVSFTDGNQTVTNSAVIDNFESKAACEAQLSILTEELLGAGGTVEFARCEVDEDATPSA